MAIERPVGFAALELEASEQEIRLRETPLLAFLIGHNAGLSCVHDEEATTRIWLGLLFSVLEVLQESSFDAGSRRTKLQASKTARQGESLMWLCATAKLSIICVPTLVFSRLTYF